jgi:hypothetical protein
MVCPGQVGLNAERAYLPAGRLETGVGSVESIAVISWQAPASQALGRREVRAVMPDREA